MMQVWSMLLPSGHMSGFLFVDSQGQSFASCGTDSEPLGHLPVTEQKDDRMLLCHIMLWSSLEFLEFCNCSFGGLWRLEA
jgi:hypothetical protein